MLTLKKNSLEEPVNIFSVKRAFNLFWSFHALSYFWLVHSTESPPFSAARDRKWSFFRVLTYGQTTDIILYYMAFFLRRKVDLPPWKDAVKMLFWASPLFKPTAATPSYKITKNCEQFKVISLALLALQISTMRTLFKGWQFEVGKTLTSLDSRLVLANDVFRRIIMRPI